MHCAPDVTDANGLFCNNTAAEVVIQHLGYLYIDKRTGSYTARRTEIHLAVNFRRVGIAAPEMQLGDRIKVLAEDAQGSADTRAVKLLAYHELVAHDDVGAVLLQLLFYLIGEFRRRSPLLL